MISRDQIENLLAQRWECPVPIAAEALDLNLAAWKQAMADAGVPEHPGGRCPSLPCPCEAMADQVTARACALLGLSPAATAEVARVRLMRPSEPLADGVGANLEPGDLYGTDKEG